MCGNILCGRFDPSQPFFTARGSFWSNGTTRLLASTTEADRQARTRNRCNGEGYESVALIRIHTAGETYGLLQCNSRQPGRFTAPLLGQLEWLAGQLAAPLARWQAEELRCETQQRFAAAFAASPVGMCLINGEDRRIVDLNPAHLANLGLQRREEAIGRTAAELGLVLQPAPEAERRLGTGQARSLRNVEMRTHHPDGTLRYFLVSTELMDVGRRKEVLWLQLDITRHQRAEEAVKRAAAYHRSLIEASLDPLVTISPEGRITDVNHATELATGLPREELIGSDFADYFTQPEKARAGYEQVFSDGSVKDYTLELRRRDGTTISVLYNASVYRDETGRVIGVFAAARDITERKRAEEGMRRTTQLLESVRLALSSYLESGNAQAPFDFLLKTLLSLTGSEFGFLDELLHDEQGALYKLNLALSNIAWNAETRKLYEQIAARHFEFRNLKNLAGLPATTGETVIANEAPHDPRAGGLPAGHPPIHTYLGLPLRFGGELLGVAGIANRPGGYDEKMAGFLEPFLAACSSIIHAVRARTRERQALEALRESEALLKTAGRTARFGGWRVNLAEGRVVWSDEVARIHGLEPGYAPSVAEGISFYAPEWRERITQVFTACAREGTPYDEELEIISTQGQRVWVRTVGEVIRGADGVIVQVQGSFQDITDQKRGEAERQRLYEQTRQEAQIRTDLLNEVNHRVKNNLVSILGIIQMERQLCGPQGRDAAAALASLEERISGMMAVHGVLSGSNWAAVEIGEILRLVLAGAVASSPIRDRLATEIGFEPPEARRRKITPRQATTLALILNELVTNSVKYAFPGRPEGRIQVSLETTPPGAEAAVLTLTYRDNGAGWPEEVLAGRREGVGLKLIRGTLRSQPQSRLELANEKGARATLSFKLAPVTRPGTEPSETI
jgi:PAS domain S-box-containing protein